MAFIDIGTNSIRLIISKLEKGSLPRDLYYEGAITRLGEGLGKTGILNPKAMDRSIKVIEDYKKIGITFKVENLVLFATHVLRKAENRDEFIKMLKTRTGLDVKIISGKEEAKLVLNGVQSEIAPLKPIVIDIGGGSTEIAFELEKGKIYLDSVELGAVGLSEKFCLNLSPDERMTINARNYTDTILSGKFPKLPSDYRLVGVGGSITSLTAINLALKKFDPAVVHKHILTKEAVRNTIDYLSTMSIDEIAAIPSLEKGRSDIILGGSIILESVLENSGYDSVTVSVKGILWGVIQTYQCIIDDLQS
jgi:exopolyphosphatase / guanosine-5'-triphosphate,3'-diphosphate pyrophosphatase